MKGLSQFHCEAAIAQCQSLLFASDCNMWKSWPS
jgi:hypothetical protein